jgi:6-phosphogluconolactonase
MNMMHTKLYTGSYADPDAPGIRAFTFDAATGGLTPCGSYTGLAKPSFIALHPNGRWLYSVSESGGENPGTVWALALAEDAAGQVQFTALNSQPSGGDWPCHLCFDRSGRWLFVANYGGGNGSVFPLNEDGSLGTASATVQHSGSGPNRDRQDGPHAHSTIVAPDNRFAIIADLGIDKLAIYRFDADGGALELHGWGLARPGAGPRHMAFHPTGEVLYVANELDCTVSVYRYHAENATLEEVQSLPTLPPDAPETTVADIHLAADGKRLYVSNRGHNSLAVYAVDGAGMLQSLGTASCGGNWPRNFALAPDGGYVLVANQYSSQLSVLPVQTEGEPLGVAIAQVEIDGVSCVQFASSKPN